jgi:2-methylisocitrate lyase-like PEP mutase family enzyme
VREYIQAGIAGAHIEDQTFPPKSGPRRRCISIQEMVGKLRAAMDAKQALDPDFVIMARSPRGPPGETAAEIEMIRDRDGATLRPLCESRLRQTAG